MMLPVAISSTDVQEVFLSSVPSEERALRRKLLQALHPLTRQGLITLWSDEELLAGRKVGQEISRHLQAARILLLLVSPACLASDNWQRQMETMLKLARAGQARVIPVLLRETVAWQTASFGQFAPLPPGGRAVTSFKRQDEGLFAVAAGLYDLLAVERARPVPVISRRLRTQPPT